MHHGRAAAAHKYTLPQNKDWLSWVIFTAVALRVILEINCLWGKSAMNNNRE